MWADFDRLRGLWSTRAEGTGGIAALAGFRFQIAASLLQLVRTNAAHKRERVFIEALSDLVSSDGGYLVVTQIKLTLDSTPFKKALAELWEIDLLARSEVPDLVPHLRYRVLTSNQILKNVERALAHWTPEHDGDSEAITSFRNRLSVKVEAEPQTELAGHLVNAFGDPKPFETIEKWIGRLFANSTPAGFEESCRTIVVELNALEVAARERAHRFRIWGALDRAPSEPRLETDPGKATLTGQAPTRADLAEGRFAPRSIYDTIHAEAEKWLTEKKGSNDLRIPAYWISGRSGTGKSVALLHLLAALHAADDRRIIVWLDQQAYRLDQAIRWSRPFFAQGCEVVFASDDPYTPERHQRVAASIEDAMHELDSASIAYPEMIRPSLILCGPSEQGQLFKRDLIDHVLTQEFQLLPESKSDIDELRHWYKMRTGRTDLPVGVTENVLIVQLFFEWATGQPILEFAKRLRKRLEGMGRAGAKRTVFQLVAEILALNRIYALFPAQAIMDELEHDPDLGSAFDRLKDDERHFSFDAAGGGYRLTHPHLANALYVAWFGEENSWRERRAHLLAGISAALVYGDTPSRRLAPLWAIARLSSDAVQEASSDASQRLALIEKELRPLLLDLYQRYFAGTKTPLTDMPVWTDIDRQFTLHLQPSPLTVIASAVRSSGAAVAGLRLSCHKLLQHKDLLPEAAKIVADVLSKYDDWYEWRALASDYMAAVGIADIEVTLRRFVAREWFKPTTRVLVRACFDQPDRSAARSVILSWLESTPVVDPAWPGMFTDFVDAFQFCDVAKTLAWKFLRERPEHPSWSHVWERLHAFATAEHVETIAVAKNWLHSVHPDISGWDRVWEALWRLSKGADAGLRARGRKWLDEAPAHHGSWGFVWQALWAASGKADADLRVRGRSWLDEAPDNGSWGFVWLALWEASGKADADLRVRGRSWLDEAPDNGSWGFVWLALWEASGMADADLRERGRKWLDEFPDNGSWGFVWLALWAASGKADADLRVRGLGWLDEVSDNGSWGFVWQALWEASGKADADLCVRGRSWLDEAPDNGSWGFVWLALWEASGKADAGLRVRGRKWLDEALADHGGWGFAWLALWEASGKADADLRVRGRKWLDEVSADHGSWGFVWLALWEASGKADAGLRVRGRKWLDEVPDNGSWSFVWQALWEASGKADADLRVRGRSWLEEAPADHGGWGFVWPALWEASGKADAELWARGRKWLDEVPDNGSWGFVWQALWEASGKADADLRVCGRGWLEEAPADHGGWGFVWPALWEASGKADTELCARGRKWIGEAPADHGGWAFVWQALWEVSGKADAGLRERGHSWLEDAPADHGGWGFVWLALWEASGKADAGLRVRGRKWLDQASSALENWKYVWQELWVYSGKMDPELRALRDKWLSVDIVEELPDRANPWQWKDAWEMQWDDAEGDPARRRILGEQAKKWLIEFDPKKGGWTSIWKTLWQAGEKNAAEQDELVEIAHTWMRSIDPVHPRWASIWLIVFRSNSGDQATCISLGRKWLSGKGKRVEWNLVWHELWTIPDMRDEEMRSLARSRLHQLSPKDRAEIESLLRADA